MWVCVTDFVPQSRPNRPGDLRETRSGWQLGGGVGSLMQFWGVRGQGGPRGGQRSPGLTPGPDTKVCWNEVVAGPRLGGYGHTSWGPWRARVPQKWVSPGNHPRAMLRKTKLSGSSCSAKMHKKDFQIGCTVPEIRALRIYNIADHKILACPFSQNLAKMAFVRFMKSGKMQIGGYKLL